MEASLAPPPMEHLEFKGNDGEDITLFLQSVQRLAFSLGKQRDNDWLVDYTVTCLSGTALWWYDGLNEDVQLSWPKLRRRFLRDFSIPGLSATTNLVIQSEDREVQNPSVPPTMAEVECTETDEVAAGPISTPADVAVDAIPIRTGCIRIVGEDGSSIGYIPQPEKLHQRVFPKNIEQALVVQMLPPTSSTASCFRLRIRDLGNFTNMPSYLGVSVHLDPYFSLTRHMTAPTWSNPTQAEVWVLEKTRDGKEYLRILWKEPNATTTQLCFDYKHVGPVVDDWYRFQESGNFWVRRPGTTTEDAKNVNLIFQDI